MFKDPKMRYELENKAEREETKSIDWPGYEPLLIFFPSNKKVAQVPFLPSNRTTKVG